MDKKTVSSKSGAVLVVEGSSGCCSGSCSSTVSSFDPSTALRTRG